MAREVGRQQRLGLRPLLGTTVDQDAREATAYILYLTQGGLGLPDRDYYLTDAPKMEAYRAYLARLFTLAGQSNPRPLADKVWAVELELARAHWTRSQSRDREKTYNKRQPAELARLAPRFDWPALFEKVGTPGSRAVIVEQPSFFEALSALIEKTPLPTLRAYLEARLLNGFAPLLSEPFVTAHFAFHGTTLSGVERNEERWKRALGALDQALGEAVGQLYVERHFRPEAKARMLVLVENLRRAFADRIDGLT